MRKAGGNFEVILKAPTLGLITRVPSDQPDARYASVASNVRFDDGVIRNAPGCAALVTDPELDSPANLIFQCNVSPSTGSDRLSAILIVSDQKAYSMQNMAETLFPATQEMVIEFHAEITSYDQIRRLKTYDRPVPWVLAVSIGDHLELWKFRPRANTEQDDGAAFLVTNDYGQDGNNNIFVRIG